ncbi:MAG: acyl carrier protein [Gemmatimonadaceae bacterium]
MQATNTSPDAIKATAKEFILKEFLPGVNQSELTNETPLIQGAILDSLATVQLVAFLEERYGIEIEAHEASIDHLNTLSDIAALVQSKLRT